MNLYVTFDSEKLFFRPGAWVKEYSEAQAIADANNWTVYSISSGPKRWTTDGSGFKPHYNVGLGKYIADRGEYKAELKRRNLIEVGNERLKFTDKEARKNYIDDTAIRAMNEMGAGFSDHEAKELKEFSGQ